MKKLITIVSIMLVAGMIIACKKQKEEEAKEKAPAKQGAKAEKLQKAMKNVDATLSKEITDVNFEKGKNVHSIVLKSLASDSLVKFSDHKGKKILIDFWSSWCTPCIEMFPDFNKLKAEYEDKKGTVKVLTISVDPMPGKVKDIMKKKNVKFEVLQAPSTLANAGILLPFTVAVDEKGKVINITNGKHSYEDLKKLLQIK